MLGEKIDIDGSALHTIAGSSNGAHRASPVGPHDPPEESANAPAKQLRTPWTSTPASPTTTSPDKDRYERLREEATKQGMKMLEEEKERNNEVMMMMMFTGTQLFCLHCSFEGTNQFHSLCCVKVEVELTCSSCATDDSVTEGTC